MQDLKNSITLCYQIYTRPHKQRGKSKLNPKKWFNNVKLSRKLLWVCYFPKSISKQSEDSNNTKSACDRVKLVLIYLTSMPLQELKDSFELLDSAFKIEVGLLTRKNNRLLILIWFPLKALKISHLITRVHTLRDETKVLGQILTEAKLVM